MLNSISLIKILSSLSRTLGVAREIIPLISGIKPIFDKIPKNIGNPNIKIDNNFNKNTDNYEKNNVIKGPNFFQ